MQNVQEDWIYAETSINRVRDKGKTEGDFVLVMRDVTNRKRAEKMIDATLPIMIN